ncbi:MAG TPA: long-chain fatty acid--CoA ligase [Bryobacteraceae bacterium]|nr:long-chain fatty acid--CoA ligase [Bryobacteraceae bacterium]
MAKRTLYTVLEETVARYGNATAMYQPTGQKSEAKRYQSFSWLEYRDAAQQIACGLRSLDIGKGDFVALHAEPSAWFYMADLGVMANGSIAAALYTSLPPSDHVRTLSAIAPKALFAEDAKTMRSLRSAGIDAPVWILLTGDADGAMTLEKLRERGRAAMAADPGGFQRIQSEISPDDYAILYMTSGATGEPKMGLVTHWAVGANLDMGPQVLPLGPEDSTLVFLPSAHIAQRVVLQFLPLRCGTPVYFSEGLTKLPNELRAVRPTFFLAPPRVWERMYASISTEIKKRPGLVRRLFYTALGLGLRASRLRQEGQPVPGWMQRSLGLANKIVFRKIRERLGGRLKVAASGAAPLSRDLAQFFEAIGLPLIEGYGLTEGGVVSLNPIDSPKPGSIGKVLPGVQVKLAEDGELLVRSECLFSGYFQDPEATAAVLKDGWLQTGDIADIDRDGFIYITGRKKELIVSSNGKKIYPARIESLFKMEPIVNQVLLIGDKQPYVTALITVNVTAAEGLKGMGEFRGRAAADIAHASPVAEEIDRTVRRVNKQLAPFEQIRRFRILDREFSIDRGEMTPTMKVRRKQVIENYKHVVNELYLGKEELG